MQIWAQFRWKKINWGLEFQIWFHAFHMEQQKTIIHYIIIDWIQIQNPNGSYKGSNMASKVIT
jgi:hypothetical protein